MVRYVGAKPPPDLAYQQLPLSLQPSFQTSRLAFGDIRVTQRLEALLQCRPQRSAFFDPFQHRWVLQKTQVRPGLRHHEPRLAGFPQPREQLAARVAIENPHAYILQPIRIPDPSQLPSRNVRHFGAEFPTHQVNQQLPLSLQPSLFAFGNIRITQRREALLQCRPHPRALFDPFQHL